VYGQFLATIHLGLAYLEITLAALFYGIGGRDDLKRANLTDLLKEALDQNWITLVEFNDLERIRKNRNRVTHFRRPGHPDSLEYQAVTAKEAFYGIIEQDATAVMTACFGMIARNAV